MHSQNFGRRALLPLLATGLILAVTAVVGLGEARDGAPRHEKRGAVHCVSFEGGLYTFDTVWRTESLFRSDGTSASLVPLASPSPERIAELRAFLLSHLGVASLDAIPGEGTEDLEAIRSLGYI
ncbi:MAG: hypothetical protein HUU06_07755 [Planctomycetaceae bacterium]|nr:hypothetical protein [Planctomycetota bacterium]NUN52666.1 hypothetical protein [Planctomycetaceae bacterium]